MTVTTSTISPWPLVRNGDQEHPVKTLQYLLRAQGRVINVGAGLSRSGGEDVDLDGGLVAAPVDLPLDQVRARHRPLPGRVVDLRFLLRRAARCCSRMIWAPVFWLTRHPASLRSAVIRGDPYVPPCSANSRATSAASRRRRCAREPNVPPCHL